LVVDKRKCLANLRNMMQKAREANIRFRPHCKTHACLEIGKWMKEEEDFGGVDCITVSSLSMAEYFASSSEWKDITVAFPVNILEIDTIRRLASQIQLNILVENVEAVDYLQDHLQEDSNLGVYLKIDTGYGRTGIPAQALDRIDPILERLKSSSSASSNTKMKFLGFLTHAGHAYHCRSKEEVKQIHDTQTKPLMAALKERYSGQFPDLQLSMGDTPTCSVVSAKDLQLFDEMRPGNFVFYDLEQAAIGACDWKDISVAVACPIVAKHPDRREIVIYGGGVHFSKDRLSGEPEGTIFGRVVQNVSGSSLEWGDVVDGMYARSLSQEHGVIVVPETQDFDQYPIGGLLFLLPVHSCMTADCLKHKGYLTTDGDWIERMKN
jgi:D-serine deaminase-like pyridoxal phosphate-dependent protein